MSEAEIVLSGGNVNANVVRIGNTVRRSLTAASPTVHQLITWAYRYPDATKAARTSASHAYKAALQLGKTQPLPALFAAVGVTFPFT